MSPNLLFSVVLVAAASLAWPGDENFIWTSGYCRQDGDANKECEGIDCSTVGRGTDEWCAARCNEDPSCVAWDNCGNSCWLHGAPRSTGIGGAGCECWVKGVLDRFVHIPAACVSGNNIELHKGKTVTECAAICDANPSCLAFGYGVDHGGSGTYYEAGDCQEQSSAEDIVYDCTNHNLDLYVKDIVYVDQPTSQPGSSSSSSSGYVMDDSTLRTAVDAWLSNPTAAEATYGHISTWDTSGVTDMNHLFRGRKGSFNDDISDISAWDTSSVKTMEDMFKDSVFNRPIGEWSIEAVTSMKEMFDGASAFDQDLGWCVDNDAILTEAFKKTKCELTSCGVAQKDAIGLCEWLPSARPCLIGKANHTRCKINSPIFFIALLVLLLAGFSACVCRRKKKDETYAAAAWRVLCDCLICCCLCCMKKEEKGSINSQPDSPADSPLDEPDEEATASESLESRAQAAAKAEESVEPSSFSRLTSFLFGEREEAPTEEEATALPVVAEAEGEATEQPPPPPPAKRWFSRESESIARNAEERHQRMAGWYNDAPEAAALRAAWGEYPGTSDALQAWPGFVRVTNAFLDAKLDAKLA